MGLDAFWSPPVVVAGDIEALADAMLEHPALAVHAGPRWAGRAGTAQISALAAALAPQTDLADITVGPVARLLLPDPVSLPVDRVEGGEQKPPRYRHAAVRLTESWNAAHEITGEAPAVLVLDEAPIDLATWERLPARSIEGCDGVLDALAVGQEQSLARLEAFLDHADGVLWQIYRAELEALLPGLVAELQIYTTDESRARAEDDRVSHQRRCGRAYSEYLQPYLACGAEARSCPMSPRMYLLGGARIGAAQPDVFVPPGCAEAVGRDYVQEVRAMGVEAAQVAHEHLEPAWMALADRLGTITEVHAALEDVCTPRRRRFAAQDLDAARERLIRIGEALSSDELERAGASWRFESDRFHVPGVGSVDQLARYDAGPGSPARRVLAEARALRQFVLGRAMCREGRAPRPLVAMLVEAEASRPYFVGYFFEEELVCADLGPRNRGP